MTSSSPASSSSSSNIPSSTTQDTSNKNHDDDNDLGAVSTSSSPTKGRNRRSPSYKSSPPARRLDTVFSYQDFSRVSTPLGEDDSIQKDSEFPNPSLNKDDIQTMMEQRTIEKYQQQALQHGKSEFALDDIIPILMEGVESIVKDSFTECFSPRPVENWNWNWYLFPVWCLGVCVRYGILVPLRLSFLIGGTMLFAFVASIIYLSGGNEEWMRWTLQWFGTVWLYAINAVVKYHGTPPVRRKNQIYVSNHTSLIDFMVLSNYSIFSTVGQKHPGFIGFLQKHVIFPLRNIFFERFEFHDRTRVPQRISEHISNVTNPPLLIFPEGVCVNNEYCVMFKKGVFEMEDVEIIPVAIKYNKLFSDPYWSSRDESFIQHILRLMKSWCTVANVWFLEPQKRRSDESAIQFANRVKKMIADRAGLINLYWDGYLKYYEPKKHLLDERRKAEAARLLRTWDERKKTASPKDSSQLSNGTSVRKRK